MTCIDVTSFQKFSRLGHPLTTSSYYSPYVSTIVDDDARSALTADPCVMLAITSGTSTGQCTLVPTNQRIFRNFFFHGETEYSVFDYDVFN